MDFKAGEPAMIEKADNLRPKSGDLAGLKRPKMHDCDAYLHPFGRNFESNTRYHIVSSIFINQYRYDIM